MAQWIYKPRISSSTISGVNFDIVSQQWLSRFFRHHPELSSVMSNKIDAKLVKGTYPTCLMKWFVDLRYVIDEYQIEPENIYNIDENGFSIGEIEASKVIINTEIQQKLQAKWSRQEQVTSIQCICANGSSILLLLIVGI